MFSRVAVIVVSVRIARLAPALPAAEASALPAPLRGVNPDLLSGGLFAALDAEGAFGHPAAPTPPRARAAYPNLAKGRPPAVLDPRVDANVRLGDDPDALPANQHGQAEPHIVRSVANPNVLLATFQEGRFFDSGSITCGYAVSSDGGLTWRRNLIPNLTTVNGGRFSRATDPVAGAGPQGELYLETLGSTAGTFTQSAVSVTRSTDGGATWSLPATVYESPNALTMPDKNWLAVNDYAGTPNAGRLVATWSNFLNTASGGTAGIPLLASVSDDRGSTWSTPGEITPQGSFGQGTQPVFLPDGSLAVVYVVFLDLANVTRFAILYKHSPDGGRTFPGTGITVVPAVNGWDDPDLRDGIYLPSATVARGTGDLFITYTAVVNGSPRVLVTKSTDRGTTWTTPVVVSDQPPGVSVMNPAIAATPDGRAVSVAFMDKRNAPDGRNFVDHYAAQSFDGGATWQPNLRLTEMSSDIRLGPLTSRGIMIGDYMGLAPALSSAQPCVAVWCDTRTGDSDPFTVRFMPTPTGEYGTWATLHGISSANHSDDTDGDGVPNYLEFINGTDPRRAESGEDLVVQLASPTTVNVAWTERAEVTPLFPHGVAPASAAIWAQGAFSGSAVLSADLPPAELPRVAPTPGLVWRGARVTIPAGAAEMFARGYRFSAGLPPTVSRVVAGIGTDARLINLSTRGAATAASPLIVGFVLDGNKTMLVRAAGPALTTLGVGGALPNPRLTLAAPASDLSRANDNWSDGGASAATFARLGAFPFASGSLDSALLLPLGPQAYTAAAADVNNASGVALVEAYDADATPGAPASPRLVNLSTRGDAGTGNNALIAGLVISGTQPRRVLLRAIGPSLTAFGVPGVLRDPVLTLYRDSVALATNDDWEISRSGAALAATAQRVGAFPLQAASLDAALLLTLAPGAYTAVITSADGGTGVALVEVYDAD